MGVGLLALLLAVAVAIVIVVSSRDPDDQPGDPNPRASVVIAALGDSYMAGEGAERYLRGTDDPATNECRRATTAYPYVVARELHASLLFAACSGARTRHVISVGQFPKSTGTVLGARPQIEALDDAPRLRAALLGIGGNDAGFGEIGRSCALPLAPDCRRSAQAWIDRLETEVFPALVETYQAVRRDAGPADVFALTYPNAIGPESCNDIALNEAELSFLRDVFVVRLNEIVGAAARAAGIRLINLDDTLRGHRLCEVPLPRAAVNF